MKRLKFEKDSGIVIEIARVTSLLRALLQPIRNRALGLGTTLAPTIARMSSQEAIQRLIDDEMAKALQGRLSRPMRPRSRRRVRWANASTK